MPVKGLPTTLECVLNNILYESDLSSYKIAGNQQRTTIVLRFDAKPDICGLSTIQQSTPAASYRMKPSTQQKPDQQRLQQHRASFSSTDNPTPSLSTTMKTENKSIQTDNETNRSSTAIDTVGSQTSASISNVIGTKSSIHTEDSQYYTEINGTELTTSSSKSENHCHLNSSIDKNDNDINEHTDKSSTNTQQHDSESTHSDDNDYESEATSEDGSNNVDLQTDPPPLPHPHSHVNSSSDDQITDKKYSAGDISKLKLHSYKFNREGRLYLSGVEQNNFIKKLTFDVYDPDQTNILAETDDLIIEYNITQKKIVDFFIHHVEPDNLHEKTKLKFMRSSRNNWKLIKQKHHDAVMNLKTVGLPLLKKWINETT